MRIAAVGDLHCDIHSKGRFVSLFECARRQADVLLLLGDITDYGLPEEADLLLNELGTGNHLQILGVLGNHDFESGRAEEVVAILSKGGVRILDGDPVEINGIGFAGTKGFGGGFGQHVLESWGERQIKDFVQTAVTESLKLESALAKLKTPEKIVLLHYAPIEETVHGEPPAIYPFVGSSRLENPINDHGATAVFHGHAHYGNPAGKTKSGVPVFNVALPLLKKHFPGQPSFRVHEIPSPVAVNPQ